MRTFCQINLFVLQVFIGWQLAACELPKADQPNFDRSLAEAESSFLNMNEALCSEQLDEIWTEILPLFFGKALRENLSKICRLGLMNEIGLQSENSDSELIDSKWLKRCHRFFDSESENKLPTQVQIQLKSIRTKLKDDSRPTMLEKIKPWSLWIDTEVESKTKFQTPSSYFVQYLDKESCQLESFELLGMKPGQWEKLLISQLQLSKGSSQARPISSAAKNMKPKSQIEKGEITTYDPKDFEALSLEAEDSEAGIFSSPWFWLGAGVVAGGAGYLIYDGTQGKTVRTP